MGPRPEQRPREEREGGRGWKGLYVDVDEHIGQMPPLVPLDSRTLITTSEESGMPVFMYWFGEELHLDAFDLAGSLARAAACSHQIRRALLGGLSGVSSPRSEVAGRGRTAFGVSMTCW
jgi:hypothetical protein